MLYATRRIALDSKLPRESSQQQRPRPSHDPGQQPKRKSSKTYITLDEPKTFNHFVMNLPATAVEFLDAFRGLYQAREADFTPATEQELPMIHVYLFTTRHDDPTQEEEEVCEVVSKHLGSEHHATDGRCGIVRCQAGQPKEADVLCEFPLAEGGGFCGVVVKFYVCPCLCARHMNLRRTIAGIDETS